MLLLPVTQQLTKFQPTLAMPRNQCHCLVKKEILKYRFYFHEKKIWTEKKNSEIIAESFYYVKYGLSNIMSKVPSKILITENIKTGVSRKMVCFGIWIHILSWRQQKHQRLRFHYFWHINWQSISDEWWSRKTLLIWFLDKILLRFYNFCVIITYFVRMPIKLDQKVGLVQ